MTWIPLLLALCGPAHAGPRSDPMQDAEALQQARQRGEAFRTESGKVIPSFAAKRSSESDAEPLPEALIALAGTYHEAVEAWIPLTEAEAPLTQQIAYQALARLDRRLADTFAGLAAQEELDPALDRDELETHAANRYRAASEAFHQAAKVAFGRDKRREAKKLLRAGFDARIEARELEGPVPTPQPLAAQQVVVGQSIDEQLTAAESWIALALRDCKTLPDAHRGVLEDLAVEIRTAVEEGSLGRPALLVRTQATLAESRCP